MDKVIVVDNFCDYPDNVKHSAQLSGFGTWKPNKGETGAEYYEGMNFWGDHALLLSSLMATTGKVVVPNSMFFRITNETTQQAYIHSDREQGAHTCVVYLSEHDQPSGTAFFKHKPTGLECMPSNAEMKEMGIFEQLNHDIVTRNPDAWEQTDYVEGKFNRAVIFDAPLFHSRFPLQGIGTTPEDGRLVWVSHFYTLDELRG